MYFEIREAKPKDVKLYKECFENEEFRYNLLGKAASFEDYISVKNPHKRYIISKLHNTQALVDIGFCHIIIQSKQECFYSGGCSPYYFNSGVGVYACVAVLSYVFEMFHFKYVNTVVYKYNTRSVKMLLAIGFDIFCENDEFFVLKLNRRGFMNEVTSKLLEKAKYKYTDKYSKKSIVKFL